MKGQQLTLHRELHNVYDRFAVVGKTLLPGKLAPLTVGHVPREISRYIWYALQYGAMITAEVKNVHPKKSPLVQGLKIRGTGAYIRPIFPIWQGQKS